MVEGSDLKYADIYGKVAQSFRATHLTPVFSQSTASFTINGIHRPHNEQAEPEKAGGTTERCCRAACVYIPRIAYGFRLQYTDRTNQSAAESVSELAPPITNHRPWWSTL